MDKDCLDRLPALVAAINDLMVRKGAVTLEDLHDILGICATKAANTGPVADGALPEAGAAVLGIEVDRQIPPIANVGEDVRQD